MKVLGPDGRGRRRGNRCHTSTLPKRPGMLGGLLALAVSGCFSPREQLLGTLGGVKDAGLEGSSTLDPSESQELGVDAAAESTSSSVTGASASPDAGDDEEQPACVSVLTPTSQVRLLTERQYDRTIRDLLGVQQLEAYDNQAPSSLLAADSDVEVTEIGWDAHQRAARAIAAQVMASTQLRERFIACDLSERDSCLNATVANFGRRAFRRPLTEAELDGFAQVLDAGAELPAEEAAQILLETFLISPSFLVRAELDQEQPSPGVFTLSDYEVATRLSYLLWGTMPDEQLSAAADAGMLGTSEGVLAQAQRMLTDEKAREMVGDFVEVYLRLEPGGTWSLTKDSAVFPEYTAAVRSAMALETQLFFQDVVLGGGSFADLLESPVAFVNADTAPLYDLSAADFGQELVRVTLSGRPGFLSRVGFLSAYSAFNRTSPIKRGAFVASMYGPLPAPPIGAASDLLPTPAEADTVRKQVEFQTAADACAECHKSINPPGFVLESFDAIGRTQSVERETGAPIDTSVEWSIEGETYTLESVADLTRALARSSQVRTEYARRWVSFALELDSLDSSNCNVETLAEALAEDGYTQLDLIAALTQTAQFLSRTQETP